MVVFPHHHPIKLPFLTVILLDDGRGMILPPFFKNDKNRLKL